MAKIYVEIGFAEVKEVPANSGIWKEVNTPRKYIGDMTQNHMRPVNSGNLNKNIKIQNQISIVADPIARENFHAMRYVEFMGTKWTIDSVDVQYPRLILTMGEVYNG